MADDKIAKIAAEEEYFLLKEAERLKKLRAQHLQKSAATQRQEMKDLHYLHCAKCGQKMETEMLAEVEIEICPDCGGIYLDNGELQKILSEKGRTPFVKALKMIRRIWG